MPWIAWLAAIFVICYWAVRAGTVWYRERRARIVPPYETAESDSKDDGGQRVVQVPNRAAVDPDVRSAARNGESGGGSTIQVPRAPDTSPRSAGG